MQRWGGGREGAIPSFILHKLFSRGTQWCCSHSVQSILADC